MGRCLKQYPFDFMEYDVTWVESNIFGAAGALGVEAIELRNWILCFRCALEEQRVVFARLTECMANSSPPWSAYFTPMDCRLVALDKRPGMRPVGIREALCRALAKIVMGQLKTRRRRRVEICSCVHASRPA